MLAPVEGTHRTLRAGCVLALKAYRGILTNMCLAFSQILSAFVPLQHMAVIAAINVLARLFWKGCVSGIVEPHASSLAAVALVRRVFERYVGFNRKWGTQSEAVRVSPCSFVYNRGMA